MNYSPHELSEHAIGLVEAWSSGTRTKSRREGYHVDSAEHGRLQVHARGRLSSSLVWFHVPDPDGDGYDVVVLVEFDSNDKVAAAWALTRAELVSAATSSTSRGGKRVLKVPVGGDWTTRVARIRLGD